MSGAEVAYRLARSVRTVSAPVHATDVAGARRVRDGPALPAAVRVAVSRRADRGRGARARGPLLVLRPGGLRSRGSPAVESRSAHASRRRRRDAPRAIDYRDERVVGNIKYLWEANRHLHLVTLAQAIALTGDPRYALGIRAQIDSWIEQCPVGRGPNWCSSLELGIRLINWSIAWQLLGGSRSTAVRRRRRRGVPRTLAEGHLRAGAHDRRQPVALLLGQQSPDR